MSYANGTQFYNLPQTVGTDKRDWFDTNSPFAAIDAALHAAVVGQASDAEAIATINSKLATDEADIAALQTKTNTHDSQIATLQTTVNAQANQISDVRQDAEDMITANNEGAAATSTRAYAIGDYFIYNDVLYKATAAIAVGDTIVPNTNCEATNVDTELTQVNNDLTTLEDDTDNVIANKISYVNDITNITSFANAFVAPYDCQLVLSTGANTSDYAIVRIFGADIAEESGATRITLLACGNGSHGQSETMLIRKGMKVYIAETGGTATVYTYYLHGNQ